jgi:hypothetical protein
MGLSEGDIACMGLSEGDIACMGVSEGDIACMGVSEGDIACMGVCLIATGLLDRAPTGSLHRSLLMATPVEQFHSRNKQARLSKRKLARKRRADGRGGMLFRHVVLGFSSTTRQTLVTLTRGNTASWIGVTQRPG